jgi:hypothetical protein
MSNPKKFCEASFSWNARVELCHHLETKVAKAYNSYLGKQVSGCSICFVRVSLG